MGTLSKYRACHYSSALSIPLRPNVFLQFRREEVGSHTQEDQRLGWVERRARGRPPCLCSPAMF